MSGIPDSPNATDPVDDDRYPLITAAGPGGDPDGVPHPGWDSDPALAATSRESAATVDDPDTAWQLLQQLDGGQG